MSYQLKKSTRLMLQGSLVATLPGLIAFSTPVFADRALEEIIVTATKREESMQEVPIAISAIDASLAAKMGIDDAESLQMAVPGLKLDRQTNGIIPFLRGVGSPSTQMGNEPAVAMFVDEVYYNNSNVMFTNYNNLSSIEVLKGPQGTLFGRNATGGVLHIKTKDPTPEPEMEVEFGYANYDTVDAKVYATGALTDTVTANIAAYYQDRGNGWGDNFTTGNDTYLQEDEGGRIKVLWEPSEKTSVLLNADYDDFFDQQAVYFRPAPGTTSNAGAISIPPDDVYDTFENIDPVAEARQWGTSIKVTHEFDIMTLVSISAVRNSDVRQYFAQDGANIPRLNADLDYGTDTFTQELRLQSNDDSDVIWNLGIYWYDDASEITRFQFDGLFAGGGANRKGALSEIDSESFAAFAHVIVPITEQLGLTMGLRRTTDDRTMTARQRNVGADGAVYITEALNSGISDSWSSWSGQVTLDYQFTEDLMGYIGYNRGFKSGTFNSIIVPDFLSLVPRGATIDDAVEPETLDAFTLGVKSEWLDNSLRLNAEAFYYDYQNLQLQQVLLIPGGGTATKLTNAAGVTIQGIDIDITALPTDNLSIMAAFQYLDGEYDDYPNGQFMVYNPARGGNCAFAPGNATNCGALPPNYDPVTGNWNLKGNETIQSPEYSLSLTVNYAIPTDMGDFDITAMYSHTEEYFFDADNGLGQIAPSSQQNNVQDAIDMFNGSISWTSLDGKYGLRLWGRNLTDEEYISFANETGTVTKNTPATPRTYGVTFQARLF